MKLPLIALTALGLLGCSETYSQEYTIHISTQFSPDQVSAIEAAGDSWTASINKQQLGALMLHYQIGNCNRQGWPAGTICLHYSSAKEVIAMEAQAGVYAPAGFYFLGVTTRDPSDVSDTYIAMDLPDTQNNLQRVVAHELGHGWGLNHILGVSQASSASVGVGTSDGSDAPGALMFWDLNSLQDSLLPTELDVGQYLWLRNLTSQEIFIYYH
jgi:hypothetical protein